MPTLSLAPSSTPHQWLKWAGARRSFVHGLPKISSDRSVAQLLRILVGTLFCGLTYMPKKSARRQLCIAVVSYALHIAELLDQVVVRP